MTRKLYIGLGIVFTISISIFIFNGIYHGKIPKIVEEINNSSIGAILTAIITVLLLSQQSSSEEIKERNVRVFEEKSARFNTFINKLWEIWDDRSVNLEELNDLIKLVSKDIILYTKTETVNRILDKLIIIAEQAEPDKTDSKNIETTKLIQQCIFDIINELAIEIDLGGKIENQVREKLNKLEEKVVPFLIQKDFKNLYLENFKNTIEKDNDVDFSNIKMERNFIWCQVDNSNVFFRVGPLERAIGIPSHLVIFSEFYSNRNFQKYRDAVRGSKKDFLRGSLSNITTQTINFNDFTSVEKHYYELKSNGEIENQAAKSVINLFKNWNISGKNIEQIVEECNV